MVCEAFVRKSSHSIFQMTMRFSPFSDLDQAVILEVEIFSVEELLRLKFWFPVFKISRSFLT